MSTPAIAAFPSSSGLSLGADALYEVVNGQQVEVPSMGAFENYLATLLVSIITPYARSHRLGFAVMETLFDLGSETPQRRPDVAFVSRTRWPEREVPRVNAWPVVPDLAVEVVSQSNTAWEIAGKVDEYLRAGVVAVWVIYPELEQVYVHESPSSVRIAALEDDLDGGTFLPGLLIPVKGLFEELAPDDQPSGD